MRSSHQRTIQNHLRQIKAIISNKPQITVNQQQRRQFDSDSDDSYYDNQVYRDSSDEQEQAEQPIERYYDLPNKGQDRKVFTFEVNMLPDCQINDKEENCCSICLNQWKIKQKAKILPCCHKFHHQCIRDWLVTKNQCPMCKKCVF